MFQFKFADIGEGIHEGQIGEWLVKEGQEIKEGDTLCMVETDKVNAEIPSPVSGKIKKLHFDTGDTINVGEVLVTIDDGSTKEQQEESAGVVGEIEVSEEIIKEQMDNDTEVTEKKVLATPVARKLAKDLEIDINEIKGSGPIGRVMKDDIYKAKEKIDEKTTSITPPKLETNGNIERVKLSRLRKTIAKNMSISHSIIPQASTMDDFDVTNLVKFRNEQKDIASKEGIQLTYMPFIIKAVAKALKKYPIFNSSYDEENEEIILKKDYNIGIAVDTEEGLLVPVIKKANQLSIINLARELKYIANGSRNHTIKLEELQGGTFTITNYGAFGSSYGVPVIKYPETAIIGIGRIKKQPVIVEDEMVIRSMMPVSLCFDHRVIDGGDAGRFLMYLKELLNNPILLLLS